MTQVKDTKRIEKRSEVEAFLAKIAYCICQGHAQIVLQQKASEKIKKPRYRNHYTLSELFPNENPVDVLKRELIRLMPEHYIETVKDIKYPDRSEFRVFVRKYTADVYIKVRAEILSSTLSGNSTIYVISFHFAEFPVSDNDFPYLNKGGIKE